MGIADIPASLDDMMDWNVAFEVRHFRFAETNRPIAEMTTRLLLGFYAPDWLFSAGRPVVRAGEFQRMAAATAQETLPSHQVPRPSYPEGYRIEDLGTFR